MAAEEKERLDQNGEVTSPEQQVKAKDQQKVEPDEAQAQVSATTEGQLAVAEEAAGPQAEDTQAGAGAGNAPLHSEVAATAAAQNAPSADNGSNEKMAAYDQTFRSFNPGQTIQGRVVEVRPDEVLVDIGYKSEGVIPRQELGIPADTDPASVLHPGDTVDVYVLRVEEGEGNVVLSRRRALAHTAWRRLEKAYQTGEIIEAKVTERVKGGLLADVGVRGFIPASQVAMTYVEDLSQYVGQTLRFKVVELEPDRHNVVLSHRKVLEEEYEKARETAFNTLQEGSIVPGVVKRITDFGAFVDIGQGVEGLLHVSEMAWSRVRHPSDILHEGDHIQVMVLKVDKERGRISLGLKQVQGDPWKKAPEKYHEGDIVTGEVTRVVDFGAFVKLEDGLEGLVHISQLAPERVAKASDVVSPGQRVDVKILKMDPEARRISLSIRQAMEPPAPQAEADPASQEPEPHGVPKSEDESPRARRAGAGRNGRERERETRDREGRGERRSHNGGELHEYSAGEMGGTTIGERLGDLGSLLEDRLEHGDEKDEKTPVHTSGDEEEN
ncbi:MAG: 30S ribosomal protein S1 [Limnochordaceae bacterium]|nr:30S ribosomal protein S1 [Limnochordaceae bacterium]